MYAMGFNILFFVVTLGVIIWALQDHERSRTMSSSPGDILKRRLARGDIDEEEYNRLLKVVE
jgi:uncharacterized membrane protein